MLQFWESIALVFYCCRAKTVLKHCEQKLGKMQDGPITLDISGIGNFGNNVVFAKVNKDSHFDVLNRIVGKLLPTVGCFSHQ